MLAHSSPGASAFASLDEVVGDSKSERAIYETRMMVDQSEDEVEMLDASRIKRFRRGEVVDRGRLIARSRGWSMFDVFG